jgi:hypothetical protein
MCVTWCIKTARLYWNHDSCPVSLCQFAGSSGDQCADCRHKQEGQCGLTRADLPAAGGCCHWNVELAQGEQPVTAETIALLWPWEITPVAAVLESLDAPYTLDFAGQPWVDPDDLGLPEVYGQGTEPAPAEPELPDLPALQNFKFAW